MVADFKSERRPGSNRNPRPDCVGIRKQVEPTARFEQHPGAVQCHGVVLPLWASMSFQSLSSTGGRNRSKATPAAAAISWWRAA
jgi:hypothetical protein